MMFAKPPPREITDIIKFPEIPEEEMNFTQVYNRILHRIELKRRRQESNGIPKIKFEVGEKVLIKNRQQPSGMAVSYTHLDVYKRQYYQFFLCYCLFDSLLDPSHR